MTQLKAAQRQTLRAEFPLRQWKGEGQTRETPVHYRKFPSPQALINFISSNPVARLAVLDNHHDDDWMGLKGQTVDNVLSTGIAKNALETFHAAQAKLKAHQVIGGRPVPAINGGAWVIPSMLSGNPMCARKRVKAKLPHKAFNFLLQCSAFVSQDYLSPLCARITRALWDYQQAGGSCTLNVMFIYGYSEESSDGAKALVIEMAVPLSNDASLSIALSTALYRPLGMMLASRGTSGQAMDGIPMRFDLKPAGYYAIGQKRSEDAETLKKLGIGE